MISSRRSLFITPLPCNRWLLIAFFTHEHRSQSPRCGRIDYFRRPLFVAQETGDIVGEGEALFTLETDKIHRSPGGGCGQLQIQVETGQEVKIGQVVALLDDSVKQPAQGCETVRSSRSECTPGPAGFESHLIARGAPDR